MGETTGPILAFPRSRGALFYFQDESSQRDSKPIDLEKLFTPASDSGELTPSRNSKCLLLWQRRSFSRNSRPFGLELTRILSGCRLPFSRTFSGKMYASSSFYSPIHPTVEDQVELARRISSSLCDISNKQSKGQSMYVNRMKRSVKWVHGGKIS